MIHTRRTAILFRITVLLIPVPLALFAVGIWCSGMLQLHLEQTAGLFFVVAAVMAGATAFSSDDDKYMQRELREARDERRAALASESSSQVVAIQDVVRKDTRW